MKVVYVTAVVSACMAATIAIPASAQSMSGDPMLIEEIVVTARKREELLQEVPASISVLTRRDIERSDITRLEDYAQLTPGLEAATGDTELDYNVTIRGIGDIGGTQNTFGLYLDGFELTAGSSTGVSADLTDVERVEVLRGPQGTTFGRNVIAGAISLTSITPDTKEFSGTAEAQYGSYGTMRLRGSVNVPLVDDKAGMRIVASHRSSDGFIRNSGSSGQRNGYERNGVRVSLHVAPTDRFSIDTAFAYQELDQDRFNSVFDGELIGQIPLIKMITDAGLGRIPRGSLPAGPIYPDQDNQVATNTPSFYDYSNRLVTLRGQYDFDSFSVVSVSGYVETRIDNQFDIDDSNFDLFISRAIGVEAEFWSTELRALSNTDGPFNWIVGAYTSRADRGGRGESVTGTDATRVSFVPGMGALLPNNTRLIGSDFDNSSDNDAIFAEAGYRFTDKLSLTAGARNNRDSSTGSQRNAINLPAGRLSIPDETREVSFDEVTWRTSLRYEPVEGLNLYGSVSKGYRAGGVQLESLVRPSFGSEEAINYEIGAKTLLLDRRLMVNLALYRTDWDDVQIQTNDQSTGLSTTDNVGEVDIQGVDLDIDWRPLAGLQLQFGLGYIDAEIVDYINAAGGNFAGSPLPNTPEFSASVLGDYEHALFGSVKGFVRAIYVYSDRRLESVEDVALRDFLASYSDVTLRLGVRTDDWTVEAFGENIFDEQYVTGRIASGFSLAGAAVNSPPQIFGVRLLMNF